MSATTQQRPRRRGAPGLPPLPEGAVRWSRAYVSADGTAKTSPYDVPVDADDRHTGHVRHTCPAALDDGARCAHTQWLEPGQTAGYCPDHGVQLVDSRPRRAPLLPWDDVWRDLRPVLAAPAGVAAGLAALGATADAAAVPPALLASSALPTSVAAWWLARRQLTRRAVDAGKLDSDASITGSRQRAKIGRRARTTGYCAAGAACWLTSASLTGLDPATAGGLLSWAALAAATAVGSYPWRRYVNARRERRPIPDAEPDIELDVPADVLAAEVMEVWETRVDTPSGALPDTSLADFRRISGGWAATIVPDVPGAIDPEKFSRANVARQIAGAYRVPVLDVTIETNPEDASTATISMQRENPLHAPRVWPGPQTCDWERGVMTVGWFADDSPAYYRWWNAGGPWHELIAGCTGSGKSEFTQLLLLAELHSGGLVLSRVIDPQDGQSFGELQDHVDWFAGHIAEAQILLLDTVKEMRRRNRVFSRRRQKTWKPCAEFPLISLTIDEAHEVLRDPICLALVEKLAKMARKTGVKLRLITQVASVTEIGNSTPIKDALMAGQLALFRTGSAVSSQVALNGSLNVDPHRIPPEWPKGSPAAGTTTAGVGFQIGIDRREMPMRTFFTGPEEDLPAWLRDEAGNLIISPGLPTQEMIDWSGPLWGQRKERIAAFHDAPPDDSDILPGDLVQVLIQRAAGEAPPAGAPAPAGNATQPDTTAKSAVLHAAVACADAAGHVDRPTLEAYLDSHGKQFATRTVTKAIGDLIEELKLVRIKNKHYEVTDKARAAVRADAEQAVDAMLGADAEDPELGDVSREEVTTG